MTEYDYDLLESEAAAMTDQEILENFHREDDPVIRKILAYDIVERFEQRVNDEK